MLLISFHFMLRTVSSVTGSLSFISFLIHIMFCSLFLSDFSNLIKIPNVLAEQPALGMFPKYVLCMYNFCFEIMHTLIELNIHQLPKQDTEAFEQMRRWRLLTELKHVRHLRHQLRF